MESFLGKLWHNLPAAETAELLQTDLDKGLDTFEIKRRADHFGPNALTAAKGKTKLERFLLQFHDPLIYMLVLLIDVLHAAAILPTFISIP